MLLSHLIEPWIVPQKPALERLAMELIDSTGITITPLPSAEKAGISIGQLPPFLIWKYYDSEQKLHLFFFQANEIGSLVEGASIAKNGSWIETFPLYEMKELLKLHPDLGNPPEICLIQVEKGPRAQIRSTKPEHATAGAVLILNRISTLTNWGEDLIRYWT